MHRFSVVAQGILIDYLEWLKPGPETLSWVATKICQSLPPGEHSLGKLRAHFTAQGVRLLPNDRLDPKLFGHQVDRQRFKQELVELMKGGKNIDRRAVRLLTLHARDVKDMRDLFWMHRSLRSVLTKRTTIYQKDPDFGRLLALLVQKMGRRIDTFDLGQKILGLYRAGLAETPLSSVQSLIKTVAKDPRAVFFAERLFERLLIQEVHRLSKQPHTESRLENLQTLQESCWRSFDTLTKTRFDRWALRRMVLNLLGAERLSLSLAGGYLSAAATSKNAEDFMYAALVMFAQVPRMRTPDDLVVAWRRLLQILTSQAQGGQFNGNGSPIADPIHDAIQRRQAKRLVGRLSVGNWRVEDYAAVAWTRGGRGSL
ncbi:MAG: hypothetical protein R3C68_14470 [Myxococcota bacterium]